MTTKLVTNRHGKQGNTIRKMVIGGMLSAITAVLVFTPIGMIPLPPPLLSATTVHIPVILAALVEGPVVGLGVGFVFGVCSLIRAYQTGPVGLTWFFHNPAVSVLPRLLVGLAALGFYMLWKRLVRQNAVTDKVGTAIAAVVGSVTNTVCSLGMLLLIYGADLNALIGNMVTAGNADATYLNNAGTWLVAVIGVPNGMAEAIVAAVIVPMIKAAVDRVTRRGGRAIAKPVSH